MSVSNNGVIFSQGDWDRLKRIAEGNPDEEKIGAFGVGFYSVFSTCDEPMVTSGSHVMAFYWKRDQLFVKRADVANENGSERLTLFNLPNREPLEMPSLPQLCKFLTSSLVFSRSVQTIVLKYNRRALMTLSRKAAVETMVKVPSGLHLSTPQGLMTIRNVSSTPIQISATYLGVTQYASEAATSTSSFKAKFMKLARIASEKPTAVSVGKETSVSAFFRVLTGSLKSNVSKALSAEIQRAQKKAPPQSVKIRLLTMSLNERTLSEANDMLFDSVLPFPQGKIYIGFPTQQTTGFRCHVAAPSLIPTVERESIDLADPYIKKWNTEMLSAVGILGRIKYALDMEDLSLRISSGTKYSDLLEEAHCLYNNFNHVQSTPSPLVSQIIEQAFFMSSKTTNIPLLTKNGVCMSDVTRIEDASCNFITTLPILPVSSVNNAKEFVEKSILYAQLSYLGQSDVLQELSKRALEQDEVARYLTWLLANRDQMTSNDLSLLNSRAVFIDLQSGNSKALSSVQYFLNSKTIPAHMPLPETCAPFSLTKQIPKFELETIHWRELPTSVWIHFLIKGNLLTQKGPDFAEDVLITLSKAWDAMAKSERDIICQSLEPIPCIPTTAGARKPLEAYLQSVSLFPDLPRVHFKRQMKEKVLLALGVRKVVELSLVFDRLVKGGQWSHVDLIKYLAAAKSDIPSKDMEKLRNTPLCPREGDSSEKRFTIQTLYEPKVEFRSLNLPVIGWPKDWRPFSEEAKLLFNLGLQRIPSVAVLIDIASTSDEAMRDRVLTYFCRNFHINGYASIYTPKRVTAQFLPARNYEGKTQLYSPNGCYTNPQAAAMEFAILHDKFLADAPKLGIAANPSSTQLVDMLLQHSPQSLTTAKLQFTYLASRIGDFSKDQLIELSHHSFVPISLNTQEKRQKHKHVSPRSCFITSAGSKNLLYSQIFDFVDFGVQANTFLHSCGARSEPSLIQIANVVSTNPRRIVQLCGSEKAYLEYIRKFALEASILKSDAEVWRKLQKSDFLLAYASDSNLLFDSEDDAGEIPLISWKLAKASDIVIVDDSSSFRLFQSHLLSCPDDDILEGFYHDLGSPRLKSVLTKHPVRSLDTKVTADTKALTALIKERYPLFVHEQKVQEKRDIDWFKNHLRIEETQSIAQTYRLQFGPLDLSQKVKVTAMSEEGRSPKVFVTSRFNMWDVSNAICYLMLKRQKLNDTTLLSSLLETSLIDLKRRGYNVDRILRSNESSQSHATNGDSQPSITPLDMSRAHKPPELEPPGSYPIEPPPYKPHKSKADSTVSLSDGNRISQEPKPQSTQMANGNGASLQTLWNRLTSDVDKFSSSTSSQALTPNQPQNTSVPTSQATIQSNLQKAVRSTRPENSGSVFNAPQVQEVMEAEGTYCDSSVAATLHYIQDMEQIRVYTANAKSVEAIQNQLDVLKRFTLLLKAVAAMFDCKYNVVHVFHDDSGPTIAFNRNGSLFCNLRYVVYKVASSHYLDIISNFMLLLPTRMILGLW